MSPTRLAAIFALGLLSVSAAGAEKVRNHFDSDAAMRPPGFFEAVVFGAKGEAEWRVIGDMNPPSAPNRLIQIGDKVKEHDAAGHGATSTGGASHGAGAAQHGESKPTTR